MKLQLVFLLSLSILFAAPFRIVTTFYPLQIMAINVAKNIPDVTVENLAPPMVGCLHDFSLNPKQLQSLSNASVLVVNGLGMESFLQRVIARYPKLPIITLTDGLVPLISNGAPNSHMWMSVPLSQAMVSRLAGQLSVLDKVHASAYIRNGTQYNQELVALDKWMKQELLNYNRLNIVTFHEAFPYFAKEYGFNVVGVIEREPGSEPNAKEIIALRELISRKHVRAVFAEPQYPDKVAALIARGSKAKLAKLDPIVTGPVVYSAYIDLMKRNVESIKAALVQ